MYVQTDAVLLVDVLEKIQNKGFDIYELNPVPFYTPPGLAWQTAFNKTKVKFHLLIDVNMLLMLEKGIRAGLCYAIE